MATLPGKIPIKAKEATKHSRLSKINENTGKDFKKVIKRSESSELLENEQRAKALLSRINLDMSGRKRYN